MLAVRITKPHIPDIIRVNYEKVEELKTALLVEEQHSVRASAPTASPIAHDSPHGVCCHVTAHHIAPRPRVLMWVCGCGVCLVL